MDSQYSKNKGHLQIYILTTGTRTALYFVLGSSRIPRRESLSGQSGCMPGSLVDLFAGLVNDFEKCLAGYFILLHSLGIRIDKGHEFTFPFNH